MTRSTQPNCCKPTTLNVRVELNVHIDKAALEAEYSEHYSDADAREFVRATVLETVMAQFPFRDSTITTSVERRY